MTRPAIHVVRIGLLLVTAFIAAAQADDNPMKDRVAACSACHGPRGIELGNGYVPRIHGKPGGYLYNQLVNFQDYRRRNASMNHMVAHLSHAYLLEIAHYFAAQQPPYPTPTVAPVRALAERGEQLVRRGDAEAGIPPCSACHGERLTGVQPNTPGLIGLPSHYILAQLGAWRVGSRQAAAPDCMAKIVSRLKGGDVEAVAAWLAARPIPDNTRPADEPVDDPPLKCGSVPAPDARQ